jgi:hypothetical protein
MLLVLVIGVIAGAFVFSARLDAQGFRPPRSGIPPLPQPPNMGVPGNPGFPNGPQPPNMGNPANPRIPNGPQPPMFETVWKCMKCGAELGRGGPMPRLEKCPQCGVPFINGTNPFPVEPPQGVNPTQPPMNPPAVEPPAVSSPFVNQSTPSSPPSTGPPVSLFLIVIALGIIVVTALVIVGFVVLIMWIVKSANRPAPRRRLY